MYNDFGCSTKERSDQPILFLPILALIALLNLIMFYEPFQTIKIKEDDSDSTTVGSTGLFGSTLNVSNLGQFSPLRRASEYFTKRHIHKLPW